MKLKRWLSCLQSAVLACLLGCSSVACLISGFSLQADMGELVLWCAGIAILASLCMTAKLALLPLGGLALLCGYLWYRGILSLSVEALLNRISTVYDSGYGIGVVSWSGLPLKDADMTPALCAIATVTVLLTARAVCRGRRAVLPVIFGLLPLCACLVVTDTVPAERHLYLLFCTLGVLMLSQTTRRKDAAQGNRLALLAVIPTALAVALLFWMNPQASYSKQQQAQELLQTAQDALSDQIAQAGTLVSSRENLAAMGALSNPHLPVMDVKADQGGTLYLREQVFDTYDGKQWTVSDQYADMTNTGLDGMRLAGKVQITTRYTFPNLYVPYYTKDSLPGELGYTQNTERIKTYTYTCMAIRNESLHIGFSQLYPADLPAETLTWASGVLEPIVEDLRSNAGIPMAVAEFVSNSALYDKKTQRMPSDETDFVRWFLEESDTGYCAHFASATAVLLQAAGIPARYVTGYLVSVEAGVSTTVYMDDAHAWVEYYNPEMGWRVLESTPSDGLPSESQSDPTTPATPTVTVTTQPPVQDDTVPPAVTDPQQTEPGDEPVAPTPKKDLRWLEKLLTVTVWLLGAVLLLVGQWQLRRRLILHRLTQGTANQRAVACWRQAVRYARLLKERPDAELFALAQKAKFSQHTLTEEELAAFEDYLRSARERMEAKAFWRRLVFRLIFAAY